MKERLTTLYNRDGTRTVLASVISIIVGLAVGSLIVLIVGRPQYLGRHPACLYGHTQHRP